MPYAGEGSDGSSSAEGGLAEGSTCSPPNLCRNTSSSGSPPNLSRVTSATDHALHKFLKENGFTDVNAKRYRYVVKFTYPLHVAVRTRNPEMITHLLNAKADPSKTNWHGETPLKFAARRLKGDRMALEYVTEALEKFGDPERIPSETHT